MSRTKSFIREVNFKRMHLHQVTDNFTMSCISKIYKVLLFVHMCGHLSTYHNLARFQPNYYDKDYV